MRSSDLIFFVFVGSYVILSVTKNPTRSAQAVQGTAFMTSRKL